MHKSQFLAHLKLHKLQVNKVWFIWVFLCVFKVPFSEKVLKHKLHLKGFIPSWDKSWTYKRYKLLNSLSHPGYKHLNWLAFSWIAFIWLFKIYIFAYDLWQISHWTYILILIINFYSFLIIFFIFHFYYFYFINKD